MNPDLFASEPDMRALYGNIQNSIDAESREAIEEYLEAHEWALALSLILFLAERERLPLKDETRAKMYALATEMKLDLDACRRDWPD